ncbi:MAG: CvpA family protein [Chloroflexia bacterium]
MAAFLYAIPWLDIFLGFLFLGLVVLGFGMGLLKEIWLLISLYLGVIVASLYGDYIGSLIRQQVGSRGPEAERIASAWGFLITLVLATAIFFTLLHFLVGHLKIRASLLALDKIGGTALGLVSALVITALAAFILKSLLGSVSVPEWAFVGVLQRQAGTSFLLRLFDSTRSTLLATFRFWLPELPTFLAPQAP